MTKTNMEKEAFAVAQGGASANQVAAAATRSGAPAPATQGGAPAPATQGGTLADSATSNIVLIGMPGAGKSTLGVVLAKILNYDFLDADLFIQNKHGKTLQKLIDEQGPLGFLETENQDLQEICPHHTVIATGGSAVYSSEAMAHLQAIGSVVYLRISYDELVGRLGDLRERGVVMKAGMGMSLADLYAERLPLYEKWAQLTVDVEKMSITDAAQKVARALRA